VQRGPRESRKSPVGSSCKAPVRISVPQKLKHFVNECLNCDLIEQKIIKQQNTSSSNTRVGYSPRGGRLKPPKYARTKLGGKWVAENGDCFMLTYHLMKKLPVACIKFVQGTLTLTLDCKQ